MAFFAAAIAHIARIAPHGDDSTRTMVERDMGFREACFDGRRAKVRAWPEILVP